MEVITIESSDDENGNYSTEDDENSSPSSPSPSPSPPFHHPTAKKSDDDDSSSSISSSDDSIWNVKGLLPSLRAAVAQNVDTWSISCEDDLVYDNNCLDNGNGRDDNSLCIISPSTDAKQLQCIAQPDEDDGSISSEDSIWNETGLSLRMKAVDLGENSTTRPRSNGYANEINNIVENKTCSELKCSTDRNTDIGGSADSSMPHPLHANGTWRIVLLMDHREFGCANNFLQTVEKKINIHFGGKYSEVTTLVSGDYMFVARLISKTTGAILDERVLDMVIERKNVQDVCNCLVSDSKKYKPLSFFEAQMYKLQHCGIRKKLFLMEGDEDRTRNFFVGAKSEIEKAKRLKRVKTIRKQLENGEFPGVDIICTRHRTDTINFLIRQLESFQKSESFDPLRPPTKTTEQLKRHINEQMKTPTFLEYLRLRKLPGIGDVKAMKIIMDPSLDWDKSFVSPSSKKITKATLADRATFWKDTNRTDRGNLSRVNTAKITISGEIQTSNRTIPSASTIAQTVSRGNDIESTCGICSEPIDIWNIGIVSCSRVAACGATFHQICLANYNYDIIHVQDGCIKCEMTNQKVQERHCNDSDKVRQQNTVTRRDLDSSNKNAAIVVLDSDDDDD